MKPTVHLAHVPYRNRGGEDQHVETLVEIYRDLGIEVRHRPENRDAQSYSVGEMGASLFRAGDTKFTPAPNSFFHLHNIYPVLGPRFLEQIAAARRPIFWTVHNHRFYCTNGLALYDGRRCEICKPSPSRTRPIAKNCNSSLAKSAYYALAINAVRERDLFRYVTKFIAPSPYIADELRALGIPSERIATIPNPVFDESRLGGSAGAADRKTVVYAGRLSEEKGVSIFPALARSLPTIRFEVFGDGPLGEGLRREGEGLPNLVFHGAVPRSRVLEELRSASAAILPSVCYEICPTSAIEALALAIPVYLVPSPSTKWLVDSYGARAVADPSAAAFARALTDRPPSPLEGGVLKKVRADFSHAEYRRELARLLREAGLAV